MNRDKHKQGVTSFQKLDASADKRALHDLMAAQDQAAVLIDRHYKIVAASPEYQKRYGFNVHATQPGRQHCYEVSHHYQKPCDQEGESCPLKHCLESLGPQRCLHIHHTESGAEHVDVQLSPIHGHDGQIEYFLETITEVKCASTDPQAQGLVGISLGFNSVLEMIQRVASSELSVLLQAESGAGKELVAEAIHQASKRKAGPFIAVDCSGLAATLFESELFGHEKGAFTGANSRKTGLVEAAQGGTLFLDETGDIPLNLQTKLLRLLETGSYRRVGGVQTIQADFRLISASHRNLLRMVDEGKFRQDLFYRISAFPLHIPALRERREDIPLLVTSILQRINKGDQGDDTIALTMSEEALAGLAEYDFPGNIRELNNIVQRAAIMCDDELIEPKHLPTECSLRLPKLETGDTGGFIVHELIGLKELEARYLKWAQTEAGNNALLASKLGMSERTLYRKLAALSGEA